MKGEHFYRPLGGGIEFDETSIDTICRSLKESGLYDQAVIVRREANGEEIRAEWKDIADFGPGKSILYPTGLLELLPM